MPKFATKFAFGRVKRKSSRSRRKPKPAAPAQQESTSRAAEGSDTSFQLRMKLINDGQDTTPNLADSENPYFLIHTATLESLISKIKCSLCSSPCQLNCKKQMGFSTTLEVSCEECDTVVFDESTSYQSENFETTGKKHKHFDVNMRAVLASKESSLHLDGLVTFMGFLGVRGSLSSRSYQSIVKLIQDSGKQALDDVINKSRDALRKYYAGTSPDDATSNSTGTPSERPIDIEVSYDGTWQKRGHTSNYGAGFCIDVNTGLIVDYHVMSKYCKLCSTVGTNLEGDEQAQWMQSHAPKCHKNFDGSSNSMEVTAAMTLWQRSESLGFRYTTMVSDGDSAVFKKLQEIRPYGSTEVQKEECVNHIQKRMYKALEKAVKEHKLGGKGNMTKTRMIQWSQYYRNAIVEAAPDPEVAAKKVWAILNHSCSTVENPQRDECSEDWCWYKKKMVEGATDPLPVPEGHKPLPRHVQSKLEPIFDRLADVGLLSRCMRLMTQNANESLHSTIWAACTKSKFVSYPYLFESIGSSVQKWNFGAAAPYKTCERLGLNLDSKFFKRANLKNLKRISDAVRSKITKQSRKRRKMVKIRDEEKKIRMEGQTYSSGAF